MGRLPMVPRGFRSQHTVMCCNPTCSPSFEQFRWLCEAKVADWHSVEEGVLHFKILERETQKSHILVPPLQKDKLGKLSEPALQNGNFSTSWQVTMFECHFAGLVRIPCI